MDTKQFTEEVKKPFRETYQAAVRERGYGLNLGLGKNAPDHGFSLEVYVQAMPGSPDPITPQTLEEIKELVGHGQTFKDFYVNVRYTAPAFAQKE